MYCEDNRLLRCSGCQKPAANGAFFFCGVRMENRKQARSGLANNFTDAILKNQPLSSVFLHLWRMSGDGALPCTVQRDVFSRCSRLKSVILSCKPSIVIHWTESISKCIWCHRPDDMQPHRTRPEELLPYFIFTLLESQPPANETYQPVCSHWSTCTSCILKSNVISCLWPPRRSPSDIQYVTHVIMHRADLAFFSVCGETKLLIYTQLWSRKQKALGGSVCQIHS